jgi:hypothetical protein
VDAFRGEPARGGTPRGRSFAVISCVVTVAGAEKRRLRGAVLEQLAIAEIDWRGSFCQRFSTQLRRIYGPRQRWASLGLDDR